MLFEVIQIAFTSLISNRLRSLLATLGIMIGITAVSTLLSIGQSFQRYTQHMFADLDTGAILLSAEPDYNSSGMMAQQGQLTSGDIAALRQLPNVAEIIVQFSDYGGELRAEGQQSYSQISGVEPNYLRSGERVVLGRFIEPRDITERARVAVLNWELARQLFPDGRPLGREVVAQGLSFIVIGVLQQEDSPFVATTLMVPITVARDRLYPQPPGSRREVTQATIYLDNPRLINATEAAAGSLLRQRHGLLPEQGSDFRFENYQREFAETSNGILTGITAFLGVIGGIALLVGGIGITNIMLVSVAERTREIGLRKAVGAKRRDILGQFLVEAILLSLLGGLGGVGFTAVLVHSGAIAIQLLFPAIGMAPYLTLDLSAVGLALAFASIVGIIAGSYPAFHASRLAPIEALRTN